MKKKLTISVDLDVYDGLCSVVGRRRISRFLNDLARPHVTGQDLEPAYAAMGADEDRERAAEEWSEGLIAELVDDRRGSSVEPVGSRRPSSPEELVERMRASRAGANLNGLSAKALRDKGRP